MSYSSLYDLSCPCFKHLVLYKKISEEPKQSSWSDSNNKIDQAGSLIFCLQLYSRYGRNIKQGWGGGMVWLGWWGGWEVGCYGWGGCLLWLDI